MNNAEKNPNPVPNNEPFSSTNQPSPESKRSGWSRRKQSQEMMDKLRQYMGMNQTEFINLLEEIKKHPESFSVQDIMLYKYATKAFNGEKFMLDWFDRNISKAPQQIETPDDGHISIKIQPSKTKNDTQIPEIPEIPNEPVKE